MIRIVLDWCFPPNFPIPARVPNGWLALCALLITSLNINQTEGTVKVDGAIKIKDPNQIYTENNVTLWVTQKIGHSPVQMTAGEAGETSWEGEIFTIKLDSIPTGVTWWIRSIQSTAQQALETFNLDEKDKYRDWETDRKSTRLNSSHRSLSRMPSSA